MYRIVISFTHEDLEMDYLTFYSGVFKTLEAADNAMEALLKIDNSTGGHIEEHVPNMGWVLAES